MPMPKEKGTHLGIGRALFKSLLIRVCVRGEAQ